MAQITTKFSVGDNIWVMRDNKPLEVKVDRLEVIFTDTLTFRETYVSIVGGATMLDKTKEYEYPFYDCHATKEELLKSL